LENYGKKQPSNGSNQTAYDIVRNHLILPNNISKLRAWIRIALAKKILVSELQKAVGIVKKLELCFYKWSITRNDTFNTWLTVVSSLTKIDFNILVKESTLNLSNNPIKWTELIDADGLHLDKYVPYLSLDFEEDCNSKDDFDVQKTLIRQIGFLEDENIRLRRSVLQQLNHSSKADSYIEDLGSKLKTSQNYAATLEEEVQRLQRIKHELEERIIAHESTTQSLLKQFNSLNK
jgi:hypothetical protein